MGKLIHLNPETGRTGTCRAGKRPCPLRGMGGEENHFATAQEAREAYERHMSATLTSLLHDPRRQEYPPEAKLSASPGVHLRRLAAGALVLSFALTGCKTDISSRPTVDSVKHQAEAAASKAASKASSEASKLQKQVEKAASKASSPESTPAATSSPTASTATFKYGPIDVKQAATQLDGLETSTLTPEKTKLLMDKYARDAFVSSSKWDKAKNKVYEAQFTNKSYKGNPAKKIVKEGDLADPYSGQELHYERGGRKTIDVDHIVSLGNVWVSGGYLWKKDDPRFLKVATDMRNLQAASNSLNRQKGDDPMGTWPQKATLTQRGSVTFQDANPTPTGSVFNKAYLCTYTAQQLLIKSEYKLTVTLLERGAYQAVLTQCAVEQGQTPPPFQK